MKNPILVVSLVLLLCFAFGCQNKAEKAELEKFRTQATVEEQNKEVAKAVFASIDAGDFERIDELLADDFAAPLPGLSEPLRKDTLFQLIKSHYTAFPDWIHVIENVIAEGDMVAVKLTQHGTHQAEYEGIPATGVKVTQPALHLITIVDGKIKDWSPIEDYLGLYQQLGMELKPKEAEKK
jgi:steroid delta-isomerase-like uncharacterized protein